MKKIMFLFSAFLICNIVYAQTDSSGCVSYHKGFFSYTDSLGNTVIVERKNKYQYEKNIVTKVKMRDRIKWLNSCTYEITLVSTNSKSTRKYKYSVTKVNITHIDADKGYAYSCACSDIEKNKGYMKKISRKAYYDLY